MLHAAEASEADHISNAVQAERERVLALLEMHQAALEQAGLWPRLVNMVNSGRDSRDQRDQEDRLQGF